MSGLDTSRWSDRIVVGSPTNPRPSLVSRLGPQPWIQAASRRVLVRLPVQPPLAGPRIEERRGVDAPADIVLTDQGRRRRGERSRRRRPAGDADALVPRPLVPCGEVQVPRTTDPCDPGRPGRPWSRPRRQCRQRVAVELRPVPEVGRRAHRHVEHHAVDGEVRRVHPIALGRRVVDDLRVRPVAVDHGSPHRRPGGRGRLDPREQRDHERDDRDHRVRAPHRRPRCPHRHPQPPSMIVIDEGEFTPYPSKPDVMDISPAVAADGRPTADCLRYTPGRYMTVPMGRSGASFAPRLGRGPS